MSTYKSQLQELADQKSHLDLPIYVHSGRSRPYPKVKYSDEMFENPASHTTLKKAEQAAAEEALRILLNRRTSEPSTARYSSDKDKTISSKNYLQERAQKSGLELPVYTTMRSGPDHTPIFSCMVQLEGMIYYGEPTATKEEAEKNAAKAALEQLPDLDSSSSSSLSTDSDPSELGRSVENKHVEFIDLMAKLRKYHEGAKCSSSPIFPVNVFMC